ncbi:MAG: YHS domain-containing (seleno)protein, partial [Alphaproteobacteria bacterium]|nr:YHS domain-containing (seleno)protein [Alphaproteobacteria bacterium]
FTQNQAVKGNSAYAVIYEGVIYYFTSDQNKQTFLKAPAKFEPAYGGWCAYAMGKTGEKVEVDPTSFEVKDGHLFLFYKSWTNNTLNKWKDDEANLNKKADANWQKLFH